MMQDSFIYRHTSVTHKETLEMAILRVKRVENAIMMKVSRLVSVVIWKWPRAINA